jgi:Tol biopolymer transport system component
MDLVTHKRVALIALATLAACTEPDVRRPGLLAVTSGEAQEAEVGTELPALVEVQVTDTGGRTVPRVAVNFRIIPPVGSGFAPGSVAPATAETDAGGVARVRWTLGTGAGSYTLHAWIGPSEAAAISKAELHATARAGVAASIARTSDALVAITVGDSVQFGVTALDRYGNVTTRFAGISWQVLDPAIAVVSREISPGHAAVVVARAGGATAVEARAAAVGTARFDIRTYVGPGRDVAFASSVGTGSETAIYLLSADGRSITRLTEGASAADPAWSPDGRQVAFTGRLGRFDAVYVMNADGSGVRVLTDTATIGGARHPAWSPDGRRIAFAALARAPGPFTQVSTNAVYVMNADGTAPTRVAFAPCGGMGICIGAEYPAWSPDGTSIVFSHRVRGCSPPDRAWIFVVNADGSGLREIASRVGFSTEPAWSPDGQRIAFQSPPPVGVCMQPGPFDVYTVNAGGTAITRMTHASTTQGSSRSPTWSPDSRIAFVGAGPFGPGLFVMNADGSERRRVAAGAQRPAWRPRP